MGTLMDAGSCHGPLFALQYLVLGVDSLTTPSTTNSRLGDV